MMNLILVALGGATGASLRYGCYALFERWSLGGGTGATLFVNVAGSFVMGLLMGWLTAREDGGSMTAIWLFVGVGMLGAFTTFSAFSRETVHMINDGAMLKASAYALVNVTASVAAFMLAFAMLKRVLA